MVKRLDYVTLMDFEMSFPFGSMDVKYEYKKGKVIELVPDKRKTIEMIEKGYIKLKED